MSYQQAQQQTEDIDPPDYADVCEQDVTDDVEKEVFDKADEDEDVCPAPPCHVPTGEGCECPTYKYICSL